MSSLAQHLVAESHRITHFRNALLLRIVVTVTFDLIALALSDSHSLHFHLIDWKIGRTRGYFLINLQNQALQSER